jgi:hypothetical protein
MATASDGFSTIRSNKFNKTNSVFNGVLSRGLKKTFMRQSTRNSVNNSLLSSISNSPQRSFYKTKTDGLSQDPIPMKDYKDNMDKTLSEYKYEYFTDFRRKDKDRGLCLKKSFSSLAQRMSIALKFATKLSQSVKKKETIETNVSIIDENFDNPQNSQIVLDKNKTIYSLIVEKGKERKEVLREVASQERAKLQIRNIKIKNLKVCDADDVPEDKNPYISEHVGNDGDSDNDIRGFKDHHKEILYIMFAYYTFNNKCFPESREQFTWSIDGKECVLFGGIVTNKRNDIWMFDLIGLNWKRVKQSDNTNSAYIRYGHSAVLIKKKLILYGGISKVGSYKYIPDVEIYHTDLNQWTVPKLNTVTTVKLRKHHVACLVGTNMFIHGGICEQDEYLGESYILNLAGPQMAWKKVSIYNVTQPTLAYHACCLVLSSDLLNNPKLTLTKFPEQTPYQKYHLSKVNCL